jgi:cholesterol 24(S)-hydroxylase
VFEESMRMYPPVPTVFKFTDRDMTILDYVIPKGTKLVSFLPGTCRNPEYFDDPNTFNPSRFEPGQKRPSPYVYYPFGIGQRGCIGRLFAMIEAKVIMAQLLHNFEIKLCGNFTYETDWGITMKPINPINCTIRPRK